ncbi:MAG: L,D-transpeptidase [Gammaproteobacteria bacterium]|nr:L,D-transpeptidase [Gammaproteobacteria bacterium]
MKSGIHFLNLLRNCATCRISSTAIILSLVLFLSNISTSAIAQNLNTNHQNTSDIEELLIKALNELQHQRIDNALQSMETLVNKKPHFKLAQLIYADLLQARTQGITDFGANSGVSKNIITALRQEARQRWQHHVNTPEVGKIPSNLLYTDKKYKHIIVVDLKTSRLYIFDSGSTYPRIVSDYYISSGKKGAVKQKSGDKKTPLGVYYVTKHISDKKLPDFYGTGAYPINYPNDWDKRLGKTGYGIWLHGTPTDTYSRPPLASDGCVAMSNSDFSALKPFIKVGKTPVVITNGIDWLDQDKWLEEQESFFSLLKQWEQDWESLKTSRYLAHYSKSFKSNNKKSYWGWAKHKKQVNKNKTFIKVELSDISMYRYPGAKNTIVINFKQQYKSNNYKQIANKRQYWQREKDGHWRIIYEGPA